jgi:hypothetical protein
MSKPASAEEELLRPSGRAAAGNRPVPGFELDADASLAPDDGRWRVRPRPLDGSLGPPVAVGLTLAEAERPAAVRRRPDGPAELGRERAVHVGVGAAAFLTAATTFSARDAGADKLAAQRKNTDSLDTRAGAAIALLGGALVAYVVNAVRDRRTRQPWRRAVGRLRAAVRTARAGKGVAQRPALGCRRRARALVSSGRITKTAATVRSSPFMNASLQRGHSRLGAYEWTTLRSSLSAWQTSHSPTPPSCQVTETVDGGMAAPYHPRAPRPGTESARTVIVLETAAGTPPALRVVRSPVLRPLADTAGPTAP